MKKLFSFIVSLGILVFCISSVHAMDYYQADQRQLEGTSCVTAYSGYYRNQVFKMDNNVLTKVGFKMKNMNGGNVTLTVKDGITEQIIVQKSQRMGSGEGWVEFDLIGDALGYVVEPGHYYSIWVGTSYYSGSDAPCWLYSPVDVYADGMMRQGSTQGDGDMTFFVNGYTIDMGRENPEVPADGGDEEETVMVVDEEESGTTEDISTTESDEVVVTIPDTAQDSADVENEEVDESVTSPELENVIVDDVLVELEEDGNLDVEEESLVKVTGTADAGDIVALIIGEKAYTSTADEDGNWYVVVNAGDLDSGEYTVEAQATNEEDLSSNKVDLFVLSIVEENTDAVIAETTEEEESETWYMWIWNLIPEGPLQYVVYALGGFLFLGLLFLLFVLIKRKKEKENKKEVV